MVNYAVNDWTSNEGTLTEVAAELETKLETIDEGKTIRLIDVKNVGGAGQFQGILIWDA